MRFPLNTATGRKRPAGSRKPWRGVALLKTLIPWIFCLLLLFPPAANPGDTTGGWTFVKEANGIRIYQRPFRGYAIAESKGIAVYDSPIDLIGVVLENIDGYEEWIKDVSESRVVQREAADRLVLYQRYNAVWPFQTRDCLMDVTVQRNDDRGEVMVTMEAHPRPVVPLPEKTVRIPRFQAAIHLEVVGRDRTKITYRVVADLGGYVPMWLSNIISREIPYQMLDGLQGEVKKEKYRIALERSPYKGFGKK